MWGCIFLPGLWIKHYFVYLFVQYSFFSKSYWIIMCVCGAVVVGASGVSGGPAWTFSENDRRQASGVLVRWSIQRGGSSQSAQVTLWTPQGSRREGNPFIYSLWGPCYLMIYCYSLLFNWYTLWNKRPANAFKIHVHDVCSNCSMFAWWLLDRVNGVLQYM